MARRSTAELDKDVSLALLGDQDAWASLVKELKSVVRRWMWPLPKKLVRTLVSAEDVEAEVWAPFLRKCKEDPPSSYREVYKRIKAAYVHGVAKIKRETLRQVSVDRDVDPDHVAIEPVRSRIAESTLETESADWPVEIGITRPRGLNYYYGLLGEHAELVDRWFLRRLAPENVSQIAEIRSVLESYESVLFAPMLQKLASATSKYRES